MDQGVALVKDQAVIINHLQVQVTQNHSQMGHIIHLRVLNNQNSFFITKYQFPKMIQLLHQLLS